MTWKYGEASSFSPFLPPSLFSFSPSLTVFELGYISSCLSFDGNKSQALRRDDNVGDRQIPRGDLGEVSCRAGVEM